MHQIIAQRKLMKKQSLIFIDSYVVSCTSSSDLFCVERSSEYAKQVVPSAKCSRFDLQIYSADDPWTGL